MTDDEIIAVVTAHKEGKKIQWKSQLHDWTDCANNEPAWEFNNSEYRVAPEPRKPREWWIVPVEGKLCHDLGVWQHDAIRVREVLENE